MDESYTSVQDKLLDMMSPENIEHAPTDEKFVLSSQPSVAMAA